MTSTTAFTTTTSSTATGTTSTKKTDASARSRVAPHPGAIVFMGAMTLAWTSNAVAAGGGFAVAGTVGLLAGAALVVAGIGCLVAGRRAAGRTDAGAARAARTKPSPRQHAVFALAVAAEVVGIVLLMQLALRISPALVVPAIALVVALHFLIVDKAFPSRIHLLATAFGCVVAIAGGALALTGAAPATVNATVGLGMGLVTLGYGTLFTLGNLARR